MPYGGVCIMRGMPYEGFDCNTFIVMMKSTSRCPSYMVADSRVQPQLSMLFTSVHGLPYRIGWCNAASALKWRGYRNRSLLALVSPFYIYYQSRLPCQFPFQLSLWQEMRREGLEGFSASSMDLLIASARVVNIAATNPDFPIIL